MAIPPSCMLSNLDLFSNRPVQECISSKFEITLQPISSIGTNPTHIEFYAPPLAGCFLDLSRIRHRWMLKMVKSNGENLTAQDVNCSVIPNLPDGMISHAQISLNEKDTSLFPELYDTKSMVMILTRMNDAALKSQQEKALCTLDETSDGAGGAAWLARLRAFALSKPVEVVSRLRADICSPKNNLLLLDQVSFRLKLQLHEQSHYLWSLVSPAPVSMQILQAELKLPYVRVHSELQIGIEMTLARMNAKYFFKSCQIKSFALPAQSQQLSLNNVFSGSLPPLFCMSFVPTANFLGSVRTTPYAFKHCNVTRLSIFVNDVEYKYTCDFSHNHNFSLIYDSIFQALGMDTQELEQGNQINLQRFKNGICFFVMQDLTPDSSANAGHQMNLNVSGTLSIHAQFAEPLAEGITVLAIAETDRCVEINQSREVIVL